MLRRVGLFGFKIPGAVEEVPDRRQHLAFFEKKLGSSKNCSEGFVAFVGPRE
jgi:hypothetical protein